MGKHKDNPDCCDFAYINQARETGQNEHFRKILIEPGLNPAIKFQNMLKSERLVYVT